MVHVTTAAQQNTPPQPPSLALFHFHSRPPPHCPLYSFAFHSTFPLLFHSPVWHYTGDKSPHMQRHKITLAFFTCRFCGSGIQEARGWPVRPHHVEAGLTPRLYLTAMHSRVCVLLPHSTGEPGIWAPQASVATHKAKDFLLQK